MKVNEEDMQTIWFDEKSESVKIIDQNITKKEIKLDEYMKERMAILADYINLL